MQKTGENDKRRQSTKSFVRHGDESWKRKEKNSGSFSVPLERFFYKGTWLMSIRNSAWILAHVACLGTISYMDNA